MNIGWRLMVAALLVTGGPISIGLAAERLTAEHQAFRVTAMASSLDGRWLAVGSNTSWAFVCDADAGRLVHRLDVGGGEVSALAFSKLANCLVSACDHTGFMGFPENPLAGWSLEAGSMVWRRDPAPCISSLAVDDRTGLLAAGEYAMWTYELPSMNEIGEFECDLERQEEVEGSVETVTYVLNALAFVGEREVLGGASDGGLRLISVEDGSVRVLDYPFGERPARFTLAALPGRNSALAGVLHTPTILKWHIPQPRSAGAAAARPTTEEWASVGHRGRGIRQLVVSSGGDLVLSVDTSAVARLWHMDSGRLYRELNVRPVSAATFDMKRPWVYAASAGDLLILEYRTGRIIQRIHLAQQLCLHNGTRRTITVYTKGPYSDIIVLAAGQKCSIEGVASGQYKIHAVAAGEGGSCTLELELPTGGLGVSYYYTHG